MGSFSRGTEQAYAYCTVCCFEYFGPIAFWCPHVRTLLAAAHWTNLDDLRDAFSSYGKLSFSNVFPMLLT